MLDEVDLKLKDWVGTVLEAAPVSFEPPEAAREGTGIGLYLFELAGDPPPSTRHRAPLQINLRYLVTAWSPKRQEEHRLLGEVLFAALEREDLEVDLAPLPQQLWTAFGIPPRPAFVLEVPARRERPEPKAPRVRGALVTRAAPTVPLVGRVLGPGDVPMARALVELPKLDLLTETDPAGWFRFPHVLAEALPRLIRVRAKGEVRSFTVETAAVNEPVTIHFPLED